MLLYALLQGSPGKTQAQKLNYAQDLGKSLGLDLFGEQSGQWSPSELEPVNQVEAIWGNDPGFQAVMDFIDSGMSPKAAVDKARELGEVPQYNAAVKGEVDYLKLATDYGAEEAKRGDWQRRMAQEQTQFEAGRKPGVSDLMGQTVFEQMGSPSVENIVNRYAQARNPDKGAGARSRAVSEERKSLPGGGRRSPAERSKYVNRPSTAAMPEGGVAKFSSNPTVEKFARQEATRDVGRNLEMSKRRFVQTPQSEKVLNTLALMRLLNG